MTPLAVSGRGRGRGLPLRAARLGAAVLLATTALIGAAPAAQAADPAPIGVRLADVTDVSFVVSWRTYAEAKGALRYWKCTNAPSTGLLALDQRDVDAGRTTATVASTIHYLRVPNSENPFDRLEPDTTYCFDIMSGDTIFDNGGQHYTIRTGPTLTPNPSGTYLFQVLTSSGSPATDGVGYITLVDTDSTVTRDTPGTSTTVTCFIKASSPGWCSFSLAATRTPDVSSAFQYTPCYASGDTCDKLRIDAMSAGRLVGPIDYSLSADSSQPLSPVTLPPYPYLVRIFLPGMVKIKTYPSAGW